MQPRFLRLVSWPCSGFATIVIKLSNTGTQSFLRMTFPYSWMCRDFFLALGSVGSPQQARAISFSKRTQNHFLLGRSHSIVLTPTVSNSWTFTWWKPNYNFQNWWLFCGLLETTGSTINLFNYFKNENISTNRRSRFSSHTTWLIFSTD